MRKDNKPTTFTPYLVGTVIIFVMLLLLHQVLRSAVRHGASINIAYAQRAEANWRCSAEYAGRAREDCISQRLESSVASAVPLLAVVDTGKP